MYESFTTPQLEETFHTHSSTGLSSTEADERLRQSGENILKKGKDQTILDMIMEQLNDPMIFILFMAAAISMLLRQFSDTAIIWYYKSVIVVPIQILVTQLHLFCIIRV